MLCCDPRFRPLLSGFDQSSLERHAGTIVGLWEDNTLAYFNPHWYEFAHHNGAEPTFYSRWELGTSIVSSVSRPLLPFYLTAFSRCRRTQTPWSTSMSVLAPTNSTISHEALPTVGERGIANCPLVGRRTTARSCYASASGSG